MAGLLLGGAAYLGGQTPQAAPGSTLPPAQPTGATAQPDAAPAAPVAAHRVEVDYTDGVLAVRATNASLNEILREVAHKTGMKITGGVADDRVFGNYGPSSPAVVLDALLDGTGSNMLLVHDPKGASELILTPRHGGATPPNPNASRQSSETEENGGGGYVPPARPFQPPTATGRGPAGAGPEFQGAPAGNTPGVDAPGGGNKTPQQIYEQLQQTMQQQKQNAPSQ
jgi:hypothetical protein